MKASIKAYTGEGIIIPILRPFGELNFTYLGSLGAKVNVYFGTRVEEGAEVENIVYSGSPVYSGTLKLS